MTERTCSIKGCGKPHRARGWCKKHYYEWYYEGGSELTATLQPSGSPMRTCGKCKKEKPASDFPHRDRGNGVLVPVSKCRQCDTDYSRDWRDNNRERVNSRARTYRVNNPETALRNQIRHSARILGLDPDDVQEHFAQHHGRCDICGKPPKDKRLAIDHDHVTGEFRGLLCRKCNSALGHFDDDLSYLVAAVQYLQRAAPGQVRKRKP